LTAQSWIDFLNGRRRLGETGYLQQIPRDLPVHVIAGGRDPVGERLRGVRRLLAAYSKLSLTKVSSKFYDGARHELLNETNRDDVTRDLICWLNAVVST
jgi:alpha-beta hydrolase superfamily lysophospholipase